MKKPTSHFSLTALRKSITEHEQPLFTLTKAEMENLVLRLEIAQHLLTEDMGSIDDTWKGAVKQWLASLEREDNK